MENDVKIEDEIETTNNDNTTALEFINLLLNTENAKLDAKNTQNLSKDGAIDILMSFISKMPSDFDLNEIKDDVQETFDISTLKMSQLCSEESNEIDKTKKSYTLMTMLTDDNACDELKQFRLRNIDKICLHSLAVFHPKSNGNPYHSRVILETLLLSNPGALITTLINNKNAQILLKYALFLNLHRGNLTSFIVQLLSCKLSVDIQSIKNELIKMISDWKFIKYFLSVISNSKNGYAATNYALYFIDIIADCATYKDVFIIFKSYENDIIDTFAQCLLDEMNEYTTFHRIKCGQMLVGLLDILSRPTITNPEDAQAGMLGVMMPQPSDNAFHIMFPNTLKRLQSFIPKLCNCIINKSGNIKLYPIKLNSDIIKSPFGLVRMYCLELLAISADFAQMECGKCLGLIKIDFWKYLIDLAFIHENNNFFLCEFRRLIHLCMMFRRRILKYLFIHCNMMTRFINFYNDKNNFRCELHAYILTILWDIYSNDQTENKQNKYFSSLDIWNENENEENEEKNNDENIINEEKNNDILNTKEKEDEWDIVSYFNSLDIWTEFYPIILLEMESQNTNDVQLPDMNAGFNQHQLDQLLCNLLGPNEDVDSSTDSDDSDENIGISIGGAKGIGNFRECVKNKIQPNISSITYNGLLYEYYFDTKSRGTYNKIDNEKKIDEKETDDGSNLFYPTYCYAKSKQLQFDEKESNNINMAMDEYEYYLSVGLNSNIKKDEFKRKNLNLVIILDKSGSMNNKFRNYSNDTDSSSDSSDSDNEQDNNGNINNDTQMTIANNSVIALLKHLTDKDRFGLVTFDTSATIIQKLQFMNEINLIELKQNIISIKADGGTDFECGYNCAIELYEKLLDINNNEYENRIIVLTDAQPNVGTTDPNSLLSMVSKYAINGIKLSHDYPTPKSNESDCKNNHIYTTFIGVGLKFNSSLVDKISECRGCNYYSVHSSKEFMNKMDEEFEYMVTPLVFNVCLKLNCEGNSCFIDKVYGVKNSKKQENILENGEIVTINTLFPSKKIKKPNKKKSETKGGIQLIQLKKIKNSNKDINASIEVTFEDRNGKKYKNIKNVTFKDTENKMIDMIENDESEKEISNNYYDNNGIRKAILLCKYVDIIMEWINYENKTNSSNLSVSDKYKNIFNQFVKHFDKEMKACQDNELQKELEILNTLLQN